MLIKNCMLIDGADIFEEMKDIRIVNGKIKEVVDCLMPEGDEEIIDAEGALVTPGIVEPSCQVGVNSQIHRFEENDANEEGPIVPELRAYDALNFEDEGFSMALRAGVTTVVTGPGNGNLIGGTCAGFQGKTDHKARGGLPLRAHQRSQETVRREEPGAPDETGFCGHDPGYPF